MNFVVNVCDVMFGGGEICVEINNIVLDVQVEWDCVVLKVGCYVLVCVIDEGYGIVEEKCNKIFELFYMIKKIGEGMGLGLLMVYGIVKQLGGFIFVDSQFGEGFVFLLYFLVYDQVDELVKVEKSEEKFKVFYKIGCGVVLLVEDEVLVCVFVLCVLCFKGMIVFEVDLGEVVLLMLVDLDFYVDVFVMDVIMLGMDGLIWVKQVI